MPLFTKQMGQGKALVLLHGWGFDSRVWGDFAERLAERYRVTLIDLPGFGQSPLPQSPYQLTEITKLILQVAPQRAHYLGWSLGGLLSCALARQAPERVLSLTMVASSPCFIANAAWPGISRKLLTDFAVKLQKDPSAALAEFGLLQLPGLVSKIQLQKLRRQIAAQPLPALLSSLALLQYTDLRAVLPYLTCPQTWILAEEDRLLPVALADELPSSQVFVLAKAGHAAFLTHQDPLLQLVERCLDAA